MGSNSKPIEHCSSAAGFFQIAPTLPSAFDDDTSLRRLLTAFLPNAIQPKAYEELRQLGSKVVTPAVLEDVSKADRTAPYIKTWDTWGNRIDKVITSDSWKRLRAISISEGLVSTPYENELSTSTRVIQLAKLNIFSGSAAAVTFYTAFADGAAYLLKKHRFNPQYNSEVTRMFEYSYNRLISRDPEYAWASGLFMTERSGGSNVYELETVAHPHAGNSGSKEPISDADGFDLGPWHINGFKFFSSGTESEMAFILARTDVGLSLFYAPLYRKETNRQGTVAKVLNGVKIQRLKQKLGTWPKTTAELEFDGTRAWLMGREGDGIQEVVHVLNIGRIHVGTSALGLWSRGLSIVKSFSKLRKVGGRLLTQVPMYMHKLAGLHIGYRGHLALMFFVGALLGRTEQPDCTDEPPMASLIPESGEHVGSLLRLLTPIAKVLSVEASIDALLQCMGALGGVGFLENEEAELNISRMYRDATMHIVLDGTPDALINEVIRVLSGKTGTVVKFSMDLWIQNVLPENPDTLDETLRLREIWKSLKADIEGSTQAELLVVGHQVVERLGNMVSGILLFADACRDSDEISLHIAKEWMSRFKYITSLRTNVSVEETMVMDRRIIFGE